MKKDITDFTEDEFIAFMHKILAENVAPTDDVLDVLLGIV
ncbi:bacteriocin immunity protein [Pseudomonas lundensis]|nr:bacteriocin immunity protein [Pseudomonas lundensis]MBM1183021.1 bacteriocin immunity protein [Pseudomonas lundensis]